MNRECAGQPADQVRMKVTRPFPPWLFWLRIEGPRLFQAMWMAFIRLKTKSMSVSVEVRVCQRRKRPVRERLYTLARMSRCSQFRRAMSQKRRCDIVPGHDVRHG